MLWRGHFAFSSITVKATKDAVFQNLVKQTFKKPFNTSLIFDSNFLKTYLIFSIYPDAIFMKTSSYQKPIQTTCKNLPEIRWKQCNAFKLDEICPLTASPDFHHRRFCAVSQTIRALRQARKLYVTPPEDWITRVAIRMGIASHFLADLICEPYEGIILGKDEWNYREKATPLSDLVAKWDRTGEWRERVERGLRYVLDKCSKSIMINVFEDCIYKIGYEARTLVQRRNFERALELGLSLHLLYFYYLINGDFLEKPLTKIVKFLTFS